MQDLTDNKGRRVAWNLISAHSKNNLIPLNMKNKLTLTSLVALTVFAGAVSGQTFSEDFGSLADGTTITTSNTSFTYVRTSTGIGAQDPLAINPSSFGTGASGFLQAPTTSLTGMGVENTLTASTVYTFAVDFGFSDVASGNIVFGAGSGTSFTSDNTFNTAHGLFWLQSNKGNFERRAGSAWNNVGTGITFANNTNYSLYVVANGSASSILYGANSLAAGTMDIFLNGSLLDDDVAVTNSLSADGFRIYSVSGTGVEIDNVQLWNSAVPVPEPGTSALLAGLTGLVYVMIRRREPQA